MHGAQQTQISMCIRRRPELTNPHNASTPVASSAVSFDNARRPIVWPIGGQPAEMGKSLPETYAQCVCGCGWDVARFEWERVWRMKTLVTR